MAHTSSSFAPTNDLTNVETLLQDIENNTDSLEVNTDTLESLITDSNTKLDALIATQDKELVYTPAIKANNGTINFYTREVVVYDSETATEVSRSTEYSTDGNTWSATTPAGTIVIGWMTAAAPTQYNTEEITEIPASGSVTFPAGSYHAIAYTILAGTADVTVGGVTVSALPTSFSDRYEADALLANDVTIVASGSGRVIVSTIK